MHVCINEPMHVGTLVLDRFIADCLSYLELPHAFHLLRVDSSAEQVRPAQSS